MKSFLLASIVMTLAGCGQEASSEGDLSLLATNLCEKKLRYDDEYGPYQAHVSNERKADDSKYELEFYVKEHIIGTARTREYREYCLVDTKNESVLETHSLPGDQDAF